MKKHHPHALLFPMCTGEEQQALTDDIKVNGLLEPITLDKQGRILDGRNREAACRRAGVKPIYETFDGTDEEELRFVVSKNLHRRQLTASQRASIAADLIPILADEGKDRQRLNGMNRRKGGNKSPVNLPDSKTGDAREIAGKAMAVSGKSVDMAVAVKTKAIPEIIAAVKNGELAVSAAAAVADLPPDEQSKIMTAGGAPAVRAAASGIRRSAKQGRSVVIEQLTPAPPVPENPGPLTSPSSPNTATAPTEEPLTTLIERAKASSHTRRIEVIEALLNTLPESDVRVIHRRCDELLLQRCNPGSKRSS